MGTKGTEIVELDVQEVIADLNRAYADEETVIPKQEKEKRSWQR